MGAITLGILAGGRGMRLGGVDKALCIFRGESLLDRTVAAFTERELGSHEVLISRGKAMPSLPDDSRYHASGCRPSQFRIVPDLRDGSLGPLAGLEALLAATQTPWLLSTPVDLRDVPTQLGAQMRARVADDIACAVRDADGLQPLVGLWPVASALPAVRAALDAGRLSAHGLLAQFEHAILDLSPARLGNLNRSEDFALQ